MSDELLCSWGAESICVAPGEWRTDVLLLGSGEQKCCSWGAENRCVALGKQKADMLLLGSCLRNHDALEELVYVL